MTAYNTDPVTADEFYAAQAKAMTERQLQTGVIRLAQRLGWMVYHTEYSKGSAAGYPDLHLVHIRAGRSMFRELKTMTGKTSQSQQDWLAALAAAGADVGIWRPVDWFNDRIRHELEQLDPPTIDLPEIPRNLWA